jgi:hypothetical protein
VGDYGFKGAGEFSSSDFPYEMIEALEAHMSEAKDFENDHSVLDHWINEYPDFETTEKQLVIITNKCKHLDKLKFDSDEEYREALHTAEYDSAMLERVLEHHYNNFVPEGMKHSDFKKGTIFRTGGGKWVCTDIGTRTVIFIRHNPYDPSWMIGPPYPVAEHVFSEYDFDGCSLVE